jgi:hypothetical protein
MDGLLTAGSKSSINGDRLHEYLMNNVSFEGATGYIKYFIGMPDYNYYAEGDREEGHAYLAFNFQEDAFDSGVGKDGFVLVGKWQLEDVGFEVCNEENAVEIGTGIAGGCVQRIVYRTRDNLPALDTPPDIRVVLSGGLRGFLFAIGAMVLLLVLFFASVMVLRRSSRLAKASQPEMVYIILAGCALAAARTIVGGLDVTDASCALSFWLGHVSFGTTYCALLLKMWRIHRVVNNKTLKRIKISGRYVAGLTVCAVGCLCGYLAIATAVGRPHTSDVTTTVSNQTTREAFCAMDVSQFQTALFVVEAVALLYGARLCWATKDVPDAINESKMIASGLTILMF